MLEPGALLVQQEFNSFALRLAAGTTNYAEPPKFDLWLR